MNTKTRLKLLVSFVFIILLYRNSYSQVTLFQVGPPSETFIKLKNDSIIIGKNINWEKNTITLDGKVYKRRRVDFIGIQGSTILSTKFHYKNAEAFYDKFNFFKVISCDKKGGCKNRYYYSVGINKVKKLNVKNLIRDINSNTDAGKELKKAKKLRNASIVLFSSWVVFGFTSQFQQTKIPYPVFVAGGCIGLGGGIITTLIKRKKVYKTIKIYTNGQYEPSRKV